MSKGNVLDAQQRIPQKKYAALRTLVDFFDYYFALARHFDGNLHRCLINNNNNTNLKQIHSLDNPISMLVYWNSLEVALH